jgi:hypothetical protein
MTAEERLLDMLGGADAVPALSPETLADCLLLAAVPDADGLYTNSDDWTPTYDFHRAAAAAWRRKASMVAADYSITIEGRELNRAQMIDNFLKMANEEAGLAQPRYFGAPDTGSGV